MTYKGMKTSIVLIPVYFSNARHVCNEIENQKFKTTTELREKLNSELVAPDDEEPESPLIYDMTDFMEEVNDQQLDILTNYFMSYVQFE
jgi:hypothetical protein